MIDKLSHSNSTISMENKIQHFIKQMTVEEKVAQLGSVTASELLENSQFSLEKAKILLNKGIGQITRIAGNYGFEVEPIKVVEIANSIQKFLLEETRLKIPAIVHEECLSGLMGKNATVFPQAIGLASTWNPELIQNITSTIRTHMRAIGAHQGLSPVLDVVRDPRWGRTEETLGEDPYLIAQLGMAYIKGLQGEDIASGIMATPKHFAAHGFSEGGRNCAPVHVSPREFREIFLFPFEAAIKLAKAGSLMNAYHDVDGIPCAASWELLSGILREEWGFRGIVVSDYHAIEMLHSFHKVAADLKTAAVQALEAGIDVELPRTKCYGDPLIQAINEGLISEITLNQAVLRVLRTKFLLGLFENSYIDIEKLPKVFDSLEQRKLALQAARESIVLLKNDDILPLNKNIGSIAVVGPNSDNIRNMLGDYSYSAHLDKPLSVQVISILAGIKSKVSNETKVRYAEGCDIIDFSTKGLEEAIVVASKSDIVIAGLGERSGIFSSGTTTGEGRDQTSLRLTGSQEELLKALFKVGKPVIVILVNGRPLSLGWMIEHSSAVLEAWLPGEEGGNAVADVLFGEYNPSGRLPISFPYEVGQIPLNYNRKPSSFREYVSLSSKALFPFGFGLNYTKFEYSSIDIMPEKVGSAGTITIQFKVKNIGNLVGDETIQLYIHDMIASVSRPIKELKGFKKIHLKPGESKTVSFELSVDQLAFYDRHMRFVVEPGNFEVIVGSSSEDIRLKGVFEVIGDIKVVPSNRNLFSRVHVS